MFPEMFSEWLLTGGLRIILILILMAVFLRTTAIATKKVFAYISKDKDEEFSKRASTLSSVVGVMLNIIIVAVALTMVLGVLDIQIGPIIAAAGVVGIAIGFGAQHLIQDVINGFFILLDDQIRVGDVVQIAGKGGFVEQIDLRRTVLRDMSGNVHFVRNGTIDVVTNMTMEYSRYLFDINVDYHEDIDRVADVVRELDEEMRNDDYYGQFILEPIEIIGLDRFEDSAVILRARTKTKPIKQWEVGREFNKRLKKRFDQLGIQIPFPHRTIYFGGESKHKEMLGNIKSDKDGEV